MKKPQKVRPVFDGRFAVRFCCRGFGGSVHEPESGRHAGLLADMSARGFRVIGRDAWHVGQRYDLTLRLPQPNGQVLVSTLSAVVARCRRSGPTSLFDTGFHDIENETGYARLLACVSDEEYFHEADPQPRSHRSA